MWDTKIGKAISRHFHAVEDEHSLRLKCRRCGHQTTFTVQAPLVYVLAECIHHLQHVHGYTGASGVWQGYLDALPDPQTPS